MTWDITIMDLEFVENMAQTYHKYSKMKDLLLLTHGQHHKNAQIIVMLAGSLIMGVFIYKQGELTWHTIGKSRWEPC
jgi:hypothetical protein